MIRTQGLVHFSLPVRDVDRSVAFYIDVVGLELVMRTPELAFLRSGKDHVVLSRVDPSYLPEPAPRNFHHAFVVAAGDFEAALHELAAHGIPIVDDEERPQGVFTGRSVYFYDPDGNLLEIIDLIATAHRPRLQRPAPVG